MAQTPDCAEPVVSAEIDQIFKNADLENISSLISKLRASQKPKELLSDEIQKLKAYPTRFQMMNRLERLAYQVDLTKDRPWLQILVDQLKEERLNSKEWHMRVLSDDLLEVLERRLFSEPLPENSSVHYASILPPGLELKKLRDGENLLALGSDSAKVKGFSSETFKSLTQGIPVKIQYRDESQNPVELAVIGYLRSNSEAIPSQFYAVAIDSGRREYFSVQHSGDLVRISNNGKIQEVSNFKFRVHSKAELEKFGNAHRLNLILYPRS